MAAALHPPDDSLAAFGLGRLDDPAADDVARHLEACPDCRRRVAGLPADDFLGRLRDAAGAKADTSRPSESVSDTPSGSPPAGLPPELAAAAQYADIRELGRGGMGVVYLARNTLMDRLEVLKVVTRSADRFVREIQAAARLQHPNVVGAYSAQRVGGILVFAMEYVPGEDLALLVKARGPLPIAHACNFAYQAALGLQHAHEHGMVHRDIKPSNLILTRDGKKPVVKILDFGLAKGTSETGIDASQTAEGAMLGTPDYIAPEQTLDAARADIRSDIYSLGCTLYHLLSGRPPFAGRSLYEILRAHHSTEAVRLSVVRPEVPDELAGLVAKMMAKDPARRYLTPAAVAAALTPFFKPGGRPTSASLSVAPPPGGRPPTLARLEPTPKPSSSPPPLPAPPPPTVVPHPPARRGRAGRRIAWAAGLIVTALLVTGTAGLLVKTRNGTIVLEGLPKDAEVEVNGDTVTVKRNGDEATVTVARGGPYGLRVRLGDRDLQTSDATVTIGGEPVRVTVKDYEPTPEPAPIPPAAVTAKGPVQPRAGFYPLPADFTRPVRGPWEVKDGELVQTMGTWGSQIAFGDTSWTDYDFTVEALRTADKPEPFGLITRAQGHFGKACVFVLGGFSGNRHFVGPIGDRMLITELAVARPGTIKTGQWYTARVEVRGARVRCYLDGQKVFDLEHQSAPTGCVGLHTWYAPYRFRKIRVTAPDGRVLFDGLPDLSGPTAAADPPTPAADPFAAGTTWRGVRIVERGQYQGGTGFYELHVDARDGEKFTGRVFENGPNRNPCAVTGTVRGEAIEWTETPQFAPKRIAKMRGTRAGTVLTVTFVCHDNGVFANDGRGTLYRVPRSGEPPPDDIVPIFDGRSLAGWETHPSQEGGWSVNQFGKIVGNLGKAAGPGPPVKHLYTKRDDYADVHVRARIKVGDGCHSGVFVRTGFGPASGIQYPNGYQACVSGKPDDYATGGLAMAIAGQLRPRIPPSRPGPPPGEWFNLDVIAVGPTIRVLVNGRETARGDGLTDQPRGRIALYLGVGDEVEFASIAVRELNVEAPKPAAGPAAVDPRVRAAFTNRGDWAVEGNEIVQTNDRLGDCEIVFGDPAWTDYNVVCEGKVVRGRGEISETFRVNDAGRYEWVIGRWTFDCESLGSVTKSGLERVRWRKTDRLEPDRWYKLEARVRGKSVECLLDGTSVFQVDHDRHAAGRVGLRTFDTSARFRDFKVTDPSGTVLFDGLPELPAKAVDWILDS